MASYQNGNYGSAAFSAGLTVAESILYALTLGQSGAIVPAVRTTETVVQSTPNSVGQSFGTLGTVFETPGLNISGFTGHGVNQAITRAVSPSTLLNTVRNPSVVLQQSGGQFLYISGQAAVVLNPGGRVITTYPSSMFGANVNAVLNAVAPR